MQQALALGPRPRERLRAVVVQHLAAVLGGAGATVREALDEAARAAEAAGEERLSWQLLELRVLVAHDLGLPSFDTLWPTLRDRVLHGPADDLVPELATVALRVLVEREELDLALGMVDHLPLTGGSALVLQHLARLSRADLAESYGEQRHAADLLRSVVEGGAESGCTLLVPEAAARLVVLEASSSPGGGRGALRPAGRERRGDERPARARRSSGGWPGLRCAPPRATTPGRCAPATRRWPWPAGTACRCSAPGPGGPARSWSAPRPAGSPWSSEQGAGALDRG